MAKGPPSCPPDRLRVLNHGEVRADGRYVLYWMNATRRIQWNYALDRAVQLAQDLQKPLVLLEALRCRSEEHTSELQSLE